jgi:hypothetical protein
MHSSNKFCKEVPIVWMHWSLWIKLWVWSHCQGNCFFKWRIVWKITRTVLASVSFLVNYLWSFWRSLVGVSCSWAHHENIVGSFWYLSKKLKEQNNYVMVDLMKAFMLSQDCPFIPQLIQEILDFKSWVNGYLNNGLDILVGIWRCICFSFLWMR